MAFLANLLPSLIGIIPQVVGSLLGHGLIGGGQAEDFAEQLYRESRIGRPGVASSLIAQLPHEELMKLVGSVGGGLIGGRRKASRKGSRRPLSAYNKFVSVQRRKGYSMKQVGQMWRKKHGGKRKSVKRGGALIGGARKKSYKRRSVKPRSRSVGRRRVSFARDPLEHLKYAVDLHLPGAQEELKELQVYEDTPRARAKRARKRSDALRDIAYDDIDFEAEEQARIASLADRLLDEEDRLGAFSPYRAQARERLDSARGKAETLFKKT